MTVKQIKLVLKSPKVNRQQTTSNKMTTSNSASKAFTLDVFATGNWRNNPKRLDMLKTALGTEAFNITAFPQEQEGSNQALFLFNRLIETGLVPNGVTLFLAAGRGSTQATPIRKMGNAVEVLEQDRASGFPKEGVLITRDKTAMIERLATYFKPVLIVLTDSFFHMLKNSCPVVPDKESLPKSVTHTGREFPLDFQFVAEVFPDVPTLSIRNFKDSKGQLCKGTFIVSDKPTVDLGTGKVRLVNPTTGTAILFQNPETGRMDQEEIDLPADWNTNSESLSNVANGIEKLWVAAVQWKSDIESPSKVVNGIEQLCVAAVQW